MLDLGVTHKVDVNLELRMTHYRQTALIHSTEQAGSGFDPHYWRCPLKIHQRTVKCCSKAASMIIISAWLETIWPSGSGLRPCVRVTIASSSTVWPRHVRHFQGLAELLCLVCATWGKGNVLIYWWLSNGKTAAPLWWMRWRFLFKAPIKPLNKEQMTTTKRLHLSSDAKAPRINISKWHVENTRL